jgi:hypothetical protein
MRKLICVILFVVFVNVTLNSILYSSELNVDPNVITVSSGPLSWNEENKGLRFRIVFVLSEVYFNVFIQKIEYGEESCCARVIKTYDIASESLEREGSLFSITDIKWIGYDSVQFKGNATVYIIKNLDGKYKVSKH